LNVVREATTRRKSKLPWSVQLEQGQIRTKDFGVLKEEAVSQARNKLLATESQIKKLRALQSSHRKAQ
jgi:hypothetical protein